MKKRFLPKINLLPPYYKCYRCTNTELFPSSTKEVQPSVTLNRWSKYYIWINVLSIDHNLIYLFIVTVNNLKISNFEMIS